jgi:hypothetical protein
VPRHVGCGVDLVGRRSVASLNFDQPFHGLPAEIHVEAIADY